MSYQPPPDRDPLPRFIGWGLMAVSVVWILLSGMCVFWGLNTPEDDGGAVLFLIGAASAAAGVGIFFLGRMLARN